MESPGEYLKREREHRGISLRKIFDATRVPMKYLEAIEADRVEGMPHPTFVKGYIRSYCKVLGLDENDAVLRFEVWYSEKTAEAEEAARPKQAQEGKRAKQAAPLGSMREIKMPPGVGKAVIILIGVVIVIIAYSLSRRDLSAPEPKALAPVAVQEQPAPAAQEAIEPAQPFSERYESAPASVAKEAVPAAPEPESPLSERYSPAPVAVVAETPSPAPVAAPEPEPKVAVKKADEQPAAKPVEKAAEKPVLKAEAKPAEKAEAKPTEKAEPQKTEAVKKEAATGEAVVEPAAKHTLTASAHDTVWIKVGLDKAEPVEVLLKAGESVTWTASENITIVIGNAGGVDIRYNGKPVTGLGGPGEVVDLRLPSGKRYKIVKPDASSTQETPQVAPAINMPEVPEARPVE